ncbi:MAG: hypothetical protein WCF85_18305 [Rhodospirillaceae bacterium]
MSRRHVGDVSRTVLGERIGADGHVLLAAVYEPDTADTRLLRLWSGFVQLLLFRCGHRWMRQETVT